MLVNRQGKWRGARARECLMRDEFNSQIKRVIADRAGYRCSTYCALTYVLPSSAIEGTERWRRCTHNGGITRRNPV